MTQVDPQALAVVLKSQKNNKGGNFTVRSKATNKDFTYRVARSCFNDVWYTQVYVETQYLQFKHLGVYRDQKIFKGGQVVTSPSALGVSWLLRQCEKGNFNLISEQAEVCHTGSCLRCGKELTDIESIESGLGPVCRSK
jgi:hypothetical protein